MAVDDAARSYAKEFGLAMAAYAVVLVVSLRLLHGLSGMPWRALVALAPVVPLALALWTFIRFYQRMDELQRRIQLDALALSFAGTILITLSYGFLQNAGLPAVNLIWVTPLMIMLWGLGAAVASIRYR